MSNDRSEHFRDFCEARGVEKPCERCAGLGVTTYANTSTWRKGFGGQALTLDVCDLCWGTGDNHRRGADLREMGAQLAARDLQIKEARAAGFKRAIEMADDIVTRFRLRMFDKATRITEPEERAEFQKVLDGATAFAADLQKLTDDGAP